MMKKFLSLVALVGVSGVGVANAAPIAVTLISVGSYSRTSTTISNWTAVGAQTAQWTFDFNTNTLATAYGSYSRVLKSGNTSLMTHTMSGVSIGSGVATGGSWSCTEGAFGGIVGAHLCGNYSFGDNATNDSYYIPTATGAAVLIDGDDTALPGGPQTLANNYSYMRTATMLSSVDGMERWQLTNARDLFAGVGETGTGYDTGYSFVFDCLDCWYDRNPPPGPEVVTPVPPAVWLFGSALGLMGVMRRKITG